MKTTLEAIIVTGMSGSGKSTVLNALEDSGYFAIDNFPAPLLPKLFDLLSQDRKSSAYRKIALAMDAREMNFVLHFENYLELLKSRGVRYQIIFLDTSDEALLRRFSETRRRHPLSPQGRVNIGIQKERILLRSVKRIAHHIIDTSTINVHQLKKTAFQIIKKKKTQRDPLTVSIVSFGYRFGIPSDSDLLFDVRFLPNPHFISRLRAYSGQHPKVSAFVLNQAHTRIFLGKLTPFLKLILKLYRLEGKSYATIGIGCTGGRHRSVAVAERLSKTLKKEGFLVKVYHRDIHRTIEV